MKNNHRDFLKTGNNAGIDFVSKTIFNRLVSEEKKGHWIAKSKIQSFNMFVYAASNLPSVSY